MTMRCLDLTSLEEKIDSKLSHLSRLGDIYIGSKIENDDQVDELAQHEFKRAIDLRDPSEMNFNPNSSFESRGIEYRNFPVSNFDDFHQEQLEEFASILNESQDKTLVFCGSGNRVSALLALYLCKYCGHPKQRILQTVKKVGLSQESLYQVIENKLNA